MRRLAVSIAIGCAALAFALVVAWLADGEDWPDVRLS